MYLAIVPQNWRFQRLVKSRKFAEEQQKHQQKLSEILGRACPPKCRVGMSMPRKSAGWIRSKLCPVFSPTSQIFLQQIDSQLQGLSTGMPGSCWLPPSSSNT